PPRSSGFHRPRSRTSGTWPKPGCIMKCAGGSGMTPERWQRIEELFRAALQRQAGQRAAFLDEACAQDPALRREVETLIAAHEQAPSFRDHPASPLPTGARPAPDSEGALTQGPRIGPYQILQEIGHGGMGTVYLAIRGDDQYRKRVAIKLVRRGLNSEAIVRRFLNERQILAGLDHPNIAKLLDGGTAPDGSPYFVM